jgi:hypothetical protein
MRLAVVALDHEQSVPIFQQLDGSPSGRPGQTGPPRWLRGRPRRLARRPIALAVPSRMTALRREST